METQHPLREETQSRPLPGAEAFREALREEHQIATTDAVAGLAAQQIAQAIVQAAEQAAAVEGITIDDDIPAEKQFFSLGHAAQLLQLPPPAIRAAMQHARLQFAESRNDVVYLDGNGLLALSRFLREIRNHE
jgi:hypothetical protein